MIETRRLKNVVIFVQTGSNCICLAVVNVNSLLKKAENCYLHEFLKEFRYMEKEVIRYITGDPEISSDESNKEYFFYKGLKKFTWREIFLLCKLLTSLDYLSTVNWNKVLLTALTLKYTYYKRFLVYKLLPFLGFCSQHEL